MARVPCLLLLLLLLLLSLSGRSGELAWVSGDCSSAGVEALLW